MSLWCCSKCLKEFQKDQLSELFGWGLYFCDGCIHDFMDLAILEKLWVFIEKDSENWQGFLTSHDMQNLKKTLWKFFAKD